LLESASSIGSPQSVRHRAWCREAQIEQVFDNLTAVAEAAGGGLAQVRTSPGPSMVS
jgi:enamine deaminase RidA (YjgF/YER057c/UK114 family)